MAGLDWTKLATYLIPCELQEDIIFLLLRSLPMHEKVEQQTGQEDCGDVIGDGIDDHSGGRCVRGGLLVR
jgi:hypothetical protein